MEPKCIVETVEENEVIEKSSCDRPYEEIEDGYIDDRGFFNS